MCLTFWALSVALGGVFATPTEREEKIKGVSSSESSLGPGGPHFQVPTLSFPGGGDTCNAVKNWGVSLSSEDDSQCITILG